MGKASLDILGIRRKDLFSPNHIGNDSMIFNLVTETLRRRGVEVAVYEEDEFLQLENVAPDNIISMARTKVLVGRLKELEVQGKKVINSGFGIENCFRVNMTKKLVDGGIPYPKSFIVRTSEDISRFYDLLPGKGIWIKRGDFHAIHKEDVSFVASKDEAQNILHEYALRGIEDAVLSAHLTGDLVKFYGVRQTGFFHWFYPYDHNHHKYALYEEINGKSLHYAFDSDALQRIAEKSATLLNVFIYGGDAIIDRNGGFHIIDLNDWPSFAPCREAAADAIAGILSKKFSIN